MPCASGPQQQQYVQVSTSVPLDKSPPVEETPKYLRVSHVPSKVVKVHAWYEEREQRRQGCVEQYELRVMMQSLNAWHAQSFEWWETMKCFLYGGTAVLQRQYSRFRNGTAAGVNGIYSYTDVLPYSLDFKLGYISE